MGKEFAVHMSFAFQAAVTAEQLQQALLRAVNTKTFGIPGRITIDTVRQLDADPLGVTKKV
jgi:hypothetical protein